MYNKLNYFILVFQLLTQQHRSTSLPDAATLLPDPTIVFQQIQPPSSTRSLASNCDQLSHRPVLVSPVTRRLIITRSLTITANWITEQWSMSSRVLCTEEFNLSLKETGVNIKSSVLASLSASGIDVVLSRKCVFTTDRGSNMVSALRSDERLDCITHIINTVLTHNFDEKTAPEQVMLRLVPSTKKSSI